MTAESAIIRGRDIWCHQINASNSFIDGSAEKRDLARHLAKEERALGITLTRHRELAHSMFGNKYHQTPPDQ